MTSTALADEALGDTLEGESAGGFAVELENFSGPFDLLLGLISRREMDITLVALSTVTDEFIAYVRALYEEGSPKALDEASEFLVVAATLLDLKAARLLPRGEVEDEADVDVLEARDLLFARLLQYKAFKDMAGYLGERMSAESVRFAHPPVLDEQVTSTMPELVWTVTAEQLRAVAEKALSTDRSAPHEVGVDHLHGAQVTVREEAETLAAALAGGSPLSFRFLVADADSALVVVVRFLALLEMFKDKVVAFHQEHPLGELQVTWVSEDPDWTSDRLAADYAGVPAEESGAADGGRTEGGAG